MMTRPTFLRPLVAAALLAAGAAQAYTIESVTLGGNAIDTTFASASSLVLEVGLHRVAPVVVTLSTDRRTPDVLPFQLLLTNQIGAGIRTLSLSLDGATFAKLGGATGTFGSTAVVDGAAGDSAFIVRFTGPEMVEATLGDFHLDGSLDDFAIGLAGVDGPVSLTIAAAVPEPQALALMLGGLGAVAWVARRRRPVG